MNVPEVDIIIKKSGEIECLGNMAVQIEFLKSISYFSGLNTTEFESFQGFIFEKTAERGEIILVEGGSAESLYFVVSGVVKIFKTSADGKEQTLYLVRPGESFNEVPVLGGEPDLATAEAMSSVVLYGMKKSNFKVILRDHPQVALNVIQVLSRKVRHLVSLVEDLSFKHVNGRVAKILLEHAADGTSFGPRLRLTQQEMAAMAGTAREIVGRSLKTL